jgi:hypothetical protein
MRPNFKAILFSILVLGLALAAVPAFADTTLLVSESGVFSSNVPTTLASAPNATWSYSFLVDSTPTVLSPLTGQYFVTIVSDFQFTLNGASVGTAVPGTPPGAVFWWSASDGGLLTIAFDAEVGESAIFNQSGAQVYSGPESAPTILPGVYPLTDTPFSSEFDILDQSTYTYLYSEPMSGDLYIQATPEPSSVLLALTGFAAFALALNERCRRESPPRPAR